MGEQAFELQLPIFQGPLDLLLQLIERRELEITSVSLALVAEQFLDYIHSGERVEPDDLADFVVVAARLMWIKSVALLPRPTPAQRQQAEEAVEDLTQRLLEYQAFRQAAMAMGEREIRGIRCYPREAFPPSPAAPSLAPVALSELLQALQRALLLSNRETNTEPLSVQRHRVEDKIRTISERLQALGRLHFDSLVEPAASRDEVIAVFLALLELIKFGKVEVEQSRPYGEIEITPAPALAPLT